MAVRGVLANPQALDPLSPVLLKECRDSKGPSCSTIGLNRVLMRFKKQQREAGTPAPKCLLRDSQQGSAGVNDGMAPRLVGSHAKKHLWNHFDKKAAYIHIFMYICAASRTTGLCNAWNRTYERIRELQAPNPKSET